MGDPIYPNTGTERYPLDLNAALGGERLRLTYDTTRRSPLAVPGISLDDTVQPSFGELWLSSLHKRLVLGVGGKGVRAARGDGHVISFSGSGGVFTADADTQVRLLSVPGGYRFVDAGGDAQELYNAQGQLIRRDRRNGVSLLYTYSDATTPAQAAPAPGYLLSVRDNFGRTVEFEYELPPDGSAATDGRVKKVVDPQGQIILAVYAGSSLSQVIWPDGYSRRFHYENWNYPWALTGVTDENESRHATITYDSAGRAISSALAGNVDMYSVAYTRPPFIVVSDTLDYVDSNTPIVLRMRSWQAPDTPVITRPDGSLSTLSTEIIHGMPRLISQSQPAGSGCAESTSNLAYDTNGNIASKTDFNGSKSCHAQDLSRDLEITRIEGLSDTDACPMDLGAYTALGTTQRKTSTQWHPDWPLRAVVAEPKKLTIYVYNGQPDPFNGNAIALCAPADALLPDGKPIVVLCKQVEQATSDTDGRAGFALGAAPAVPGDPMYGSVTALLHLDGASGSGAIADAAPGAHAWVITGTAALSAGQSRFGGASLQLGNGAAMTSALGDFLFGSGDFTVEAWVYKTSSPSEAAIADVWAPGECSWYMGSNGNNQLTFYTSTAIGKRVGGAVGSAIGDMCTTNEGCPPCKTVSGKVVPVGTIGYRPLDVIPDTVKQHGVFGSHHNIFVANQMPAPKCDCFWAKQKWVAKPDALMPTWIPVEPFLNQ